MLVCLSLGMLTAGLPARAAPDPNYRPDWEARRLQKIQSLQRELGASQTYLAAFEQAASQIERRQLPIIIFRDPYASPQELGRRMVLYGTSKGFSQMGFTIPVDGSSAQRKETLKKALLIGRTWMSPEDVARWSDTLDQFTGAEVDALLNQGRLPSEWVPLGLDGVPHAAPSGVELTLIIPNGPAAVAGLRVKDLITHVERQPVRTPEELTNRLSAYGDGAAVRLSVIRLSVTLPPVTLTLRERPALAIGEALAPSLKSSVEPKKIQYRKRLRELDQQLAETRAMTEVEYARQHPPRWDVTSLLSASAGGHMVSTWAPMLYTNENYNFIIRSDSRPATLTQLEQQIRAVEEAVKIEGASLNSPELDGLREAYAYVAAMTDDEFTGHTRRLLQAHAARKGSGTDMVKIRVETEGADDEGGEGDARPDGYASGLSSRLGISTKPASPKDLKAIGASGGLAITAVTPKSPAAQAKLQVGDLLSRCEGEAVTTPKGLGKLLKTFSPGSRIKLEVWRAGKKLVVPVTLQAAP